MERGGEILDKYIHKVQYYETDRMGITHHSNYIRWMEEARVDFLDKIGFGFDKIEEYGVMSPVVGINCEYKEPTTFADEVEIYCKIKEYKGVKLVIEYEMKNIKTGNLVFVGTSIHCFVDKENRLVRLKNCLPELDEKLKSYND